MSIFRIKGQAQKTVRYDRAEVRITFVSLNKNSYEASQKVMSDCEKFLEDVKNLGISAEQFTLDYDRNDMSYGDEDEFSANRSIKIRIPFNMELINQIRELLDEGKYSFRFDLNYELSNREEIHCQLLADALKDSKRTAELLAQTMDMKVIRIESVNVDDIETGMINDMEYERYTLCCRTSSYTESNNLKAGETAEYESIDVKWVIE